MAHMRLAFRHHNKNVILMHAKRDSKIMKKTSGGGEAKNIAFGKHDDGQGAALGTFGNHAERRGGKKDHSQSIPKNEPDRRKQAGTYSREHPEIIATHRADLGGIPKTCQGGRLVF
jgi:hypothetical protein